MGSTHVGPLSQRETHNKESQGDSDRADNRSDQLAVSSEAHRGGHGSEFGRHSAKCKVQAPRLPSACTPQWELSMALHRPPVPRSDRQ